MVNQYRLNSHTIYSSYWFLSCTLPISILFKVLLHYECTLMFHSQQFFKMYFVSTSKTLYIYSNMIYFYTFSPINHYWLVMKVFIILCGNFYVSSLSKAFIYVFQLNVITSKHLQYTSIYLFCVCFMTMFVIDQPHF